VRRSLAGIWGAAQSALSVAIAATCMLPAGAKTDARPFASWNVCHAGQRPAENRPARLAEASCSIPQSLQESRARTEPNRDCLRLNRVWG